MAPREPTPLVVMEPGNTGQGEAADVLRRQAESPWLIAIDNPYGMAILVRKPPDRASPVGPPAKHLMPRRIERAIEMLRSTKDPLVEIALATGFNSQAHFTTSFCEATGVTPARWRRERMG